MLETQNIKAQSFASCLELWYKKNRRELPWRENINPYSVWLSEIILQQTQVKQGWDYFLRIVDAFPTVYDLAKANTDDFYAYWAGLGYYSRARNLLKTAKMVVEEYGGAFPDTKPELLKLPGVGDYTASAIASICFNSNDIAMDGNLNRVFSRVAEFSKDLKVQKNKNELKAMAQNYAPNIGLGDFNQSLMDLGSSICTSQKPKCDLCPVSAFCGARKNNTQLLYPHKSKTAKKETLHLHYFIPSTNAILVQKREESIWNKLYEFPGFWLNDKNQCVYNNLNTDHLPIPTANPIWQTKHLLSHKIMHIHFHINDNIQPRNFEKLPYNEWASKAFPRPLEKFLHDKFSVS